MSGFPGRVICTGAALALGSIAGLHSPIVGVALAQRAGEVDGFSVTRVRLSDGGAFAETGRGRWTEFDANGQPVQRFDEEARSNFSVSLIDEASGLSVVIDLRSLEIKTNFPRRRAYRITGLETDGRRRPANSGVARSRSDDGLGSDGARYVEVQHIWDDRDAAQVCRRKAAELNARWTGAWRHQARGSRSECEINEH